MANRVHVFETAHPPAPRAARPPAACGARRCQRPGCGRTLALDARAGAPDGVAAAAAARRGLDVACACGAAFCFSCLRPPHEPASCDSARARTLSDDPRVFPGRARPLYALACSRPGPPLQACCAAWVRVGPDPAARQCAARPRPCARSRAASNGMHSSGPARRLSHSAVRAAAAATRRAGCAERGPPVAPQQRPRARQRAHAARAGGAQAREWEGVLRVARAEAASRDASWLSRNTKACPGCGSRIQKNGGCNHMVCSLCRRHFCWVCGGDWAEHNSATGGYYRCNRYAPAADGAEPGGASAPWAFIGDFLGKIQARHHPSCLRSYGRVPGSGACEPAQLRGALLRNGAPRGCRHRPRQGSDLRRRWPRLQPPRPRRRNEEPARRAGRGARARPCARPRAGRARRTRRRASG